MNNKSYTSRMLQQHERLKGLRKRRIKHQMKQPKKHSQSDVVTDRIFNMIGAYREGLYDFKEVAAYIKGAMDYHCREIEPWGGTEVHEMAIHQEDDSNE